ncbi:hypothetical protein GCM10025870_08340 [Agromyces marinus]|uniref:LGFP repeat-containing protein n=1 Tax=Agromyces marinus TaxID=1389020 RepID=A0ABM8GZ44_9MICO|nr:hypothetical protein [Agromyces marinus]BDZ53761.1 hypothetical protein GCM10025870_08340 [Agromyces marinus]
MARIARRTAVLVTAVAVLAGLLTGFQVASSPVPAAHAADGRDFDPGLIITDEVFYQSRTMTVAQVQSFLNAQVPSCAAGYTCLRSYVETSRSQPKRAEGCSAYAGQRESAALIIYKVAAACGINPRVLLVLLEKEQGLVSDSMPSARQYRSATGYGCPDTADCDTLYYGFFNQVYHAAWQFRKYRAYPDIRRYQAGRNNTIQWHPNAACGSSTVYIRNQATAGLYVYTPYRPNAAALRNLYGTGDSCSSYGNRNFWRLFTDWFGSTGVAVVSDVFDALYASSGGASGPLGLPTAGAVRLADGGYSQRFQGGWAYRSPDGSAFWTAGAISQEFARRGGPSSNLGYPDGPYQVVAGGRVQKFEKGSMYWSKAGGVRSTHGQLSLDYTAIGGPTSALGFPIGNYATHATVGRSQRFERGWLYWGPETGSVPTVGAIARRYAAAGGATQPIGFPSAPAAAPGTDGATTQPFENGSYHASAVGTAYLLDAIAAGYSQLGGATGRLGHPVSDTVAVAGGFTQQFKGIWLIVSEEGMPGPHRAVSAPST